MRSRRVRAWLESRDVVVWAAALAVLVTLPSLGLGLAFDDFWHRVYLLGEGRWAVAARGPLALFTFYDGDPARTHRLVDLGVSPWWTDPSIRIAFLRPIAACTHWLDYHLWPDTPALMHLHSIAWYGALVGIAAALYRRWSSGKLAAAIAAACFAVDYAHGLPAAWVANRNAMVAATFGLLTLLLHHRGRGSSTWSRWAAPVALLAALFSAEAAVGVLGYLLAYALFLDGDAHSPERGGRARRRGVVARIGSLWPHAPAVVIWAVVYRIGGYGVHGSGMYLDPGREPLQYLAAVAAHLPVLLASELGAPLADFHVLASASARIVMVGVAALVVTLGALVLAPLLRKSAAARFFAVGAVLSALPSCATAPSLRLLLLPSFGLLGLLGALGAALVDREPWIAWGRGRRLAPAFAAYVVGGHLVIAPLAIQVTERQMSMVQGLVAELAAGMPDRPEVAKARVVLVNAPDALLAGYLGVYRDHHGGVAPASMLSLAIGTRPVTIERRDARTLVVRSEGGFYRGTTELLTRQRQSPMPVGSRVELTGVSISITHATEGVPDEAAFRFEESLESSSLVFRRWSGVALVPFELPAPGTTTHIEAQAITL